MKRHEKLHKLANAIREYRGQYDPKTGIWKHAPRPTVEERMLKWLKILRPTNWLKDSAAIDGFKTFHEFRAWMKKVEGVPTPSTISGGNGENKEIRRKL